jgi:hypothetical protein
MAPWSELTINDIGHKAFPLGENYLAYEYTSEVQIREKSI